MAFGLLLGCEQPVSAPPRGGEGLLPAAESASYVVVGHIENRDKIDLHGYASWLRVERTVPPEERAQARLRIAWEELATKRAPRFDVGDVVLVALTELPQASLWDQRFPGARADRSVLAVAAAGGAYMLNPDAVSLDLLDGYLRIPPAAREKSTGVEALARLVASASLGVAESAVRRLGALDDLAKVGELPLRPLATALSDGGRSLSLRREIIELIGSRKLRALRAQLDGLAAPGSDLRAPALAAIAAIDGSLPAALVTQLLSSDDSAVRAVGVEHAAEAALARIRSLIKEDPAPAVRAAAATAIIRMNGVDAFPDVIPALADSESNVRLAAVHAVAALGAPAVPLLTDLALQGSVAAATGAVLALDQCGASGRTALINLATDHPDERVRNVALLALGKLGHDH